MNDILLIGNIKLVSNEMLGKFEEKQKVILCGEPSVQEFAQKNVVLYPFREDDKEYNGIYKSYGFDTVVYFSRVLDGQKRLYNELESLENALYSASLSNVKNFIYLTTNDYSDEVSSTRTRMLKTCEDICKQFVDERNISVTILRVPYLYSTEETASNLISVIKSAREENAIKLDGTKQQVTDLLNVEDLGTLISRMHDEPMTGFHVVDITGGNAIEFERIGEIISKATGITEISYRGYKEAIPVYSDSRVMRQLYGWFPIHLLEDDIDEILSTLEMNTQNSQVRKVKRIRNDKISNFLLVALEMIFVFVLSEFLNSWTLSNYRLDYVDFRLLFVIIIGTMHGTVAGIIASLLACVGYFASDLSVGNWEIIFFNIENWLPFASYFLSGTIVGHVRDKNKEEIHFLNEQQEILENKYNFLSDLYARTLENKEEFSRQILGYEDSFGKLYQVVRKLNSTMTDNIFYEAVFSIEEILKNTSVAIYTIGQNSHFARLNICSRDMNQTLGKSLDLEQFPAVTEALMQNQNWYNAESLPNYPAYAAPVWKDDQLHGAILIWEAEATQMKMDYYNKFSILAGLVQDALIRAIEYGEQQLETQMIENTKILKPEYFEEIIALKEKAGKEGMSDYTLLEILAPNLSLEKLGDMVSNGIRNTDMIGMRNDKKIYLLLNQANEKSLEIVRNRLEAKEIKLIKR